MTDAPGPGRASLVAAVLALAAVVLTNASPLLPGLHSDGIHYLESARALGRLDAPTLPIGSWERADSASLLAHYPPGFPMTMAPLTAAGVSPPLAAVVVMALSAAVTLALAATLAGIAGGGAAGAWIALVLVGASPGWLRLHTAVWSEPLYLALLALTLLVMVRSPDRGGVHGVLGLACTAVRYVGLSVVAAAVLLAWSRGGAPVQRLKRSVRAAGPALLFLIGWQAIVGADGEAVRSLALYPGLGRWLAALPGSALASAAPAGGAWAGGVVILGAVTLVARSGLWRADGTGDGEAAAWRRLVGLATAVSLLHLGVMVAARGLADPRIPTDARMLAPVLLLGGIACAAALGHAARSQRARATAVAVVVSGWAVVSGAGIVRGVRSVQAEGQFYTSTFWFRSTLIGWAREHASTGPLPYSTEPELLYLHTGRPARRLPRAGADLEAFREAWRSRPGPVVLVNPPHPGDLPAAAILDGLELEPVLAAPEGVVWWRPPG